MSRDNSVDFLIILGVVTLTSFLTPFNSSGFNIALPSITREFSLDAVTMNWATLSYLLTSAMFLVPFGRLADIFGRKRIFLPGTILFSIASLLLGIFPSAQFIILLRSLQGFASAMIFGTGVAILFSVTPPNRKGLVLGINAATVYVGLSTGPFIGGLLIGLFGWRSILFTSAGIGLLVSFIIFFGLKSEMSDAAGESFDLHGSIAYSLTLLSLMYGFSLLPSLNSVLPLTVGIIGFAIFIVIEPKAKHPVLDLRLFIENRAFAFGNLAALINFSSTYAVTFLLSLYLQYILSITPQDAGLILMASPVVQAFIAPFSGRLSDRVEPRKISAIGMMISSLGLGSLSLIDRNTPLIAILGALTLLGLGLALFSSPNTNSIMSAVDRRFLGFASSTIGTMRLLGQMLSQGIAMIVFAIYLGPLLITSNVYPKLEASVKIAFTIFVALSLIGVVSTIMEGRVRRSHIS